MSTWLYSDDLPVAIQTVEDLTEQQITDLETNLGVRFSSVSVAGGPDVFRPTPDDKTPTYLQAWLFARRELGMLARDFDKLVDAGFITPDES